MPVDVSVEELRARATDVLERVEGGERVRITADGRPVAELVPLTARDTWVPRERVVAALRQADAELTPQLADVLGGATGEL